MGGDAKLAAIKSLKAKLTVIQKTPQGDFPMPMESIIVYPDHLHAEIQAAQGTVTIVVAPDSAFASSGMGTQAMVDVQRQHLDALACRCFQRRVQQGGRVAAAAVGDRAARHLQC